LSFLPNVFSSSSDALVALRRISEFLTAEELADSMHIDFESKCGVEAEGDFTWETVRKVITDIVFSNPVTRKSH
jgi:ATP-binding cassette, subfamily C (CFTR/MRP), member 1